MVPKNISTFASISRRRINSAWTAMPLVRKFAEDRHRAAVTRHVDTLPLLPSGFGQLLTELRQERVSQHDVSAWMPAEVHDSARRLIAELGAKASPASTIRASPTEIAADATLFTWGLTNGFLELAENYIELPVRYLGVEIKRERGDGASTGPRRWHMDVEDRRLIKVIIYVVDVGADRGPFEYMNEDASSRAAKALRYASGYVSDSAIRQVSEDEERHQITGSSGWAIFVDSTRVFHRASPPTSGDRYSMTYSYASRKSIVVAPECMVGRTDVQRLVQGLSPRQRAAALAH